MPKWPMVILIHIFRRKFGFNADDCNYTFGPSHDQIPKVGMYTILHWSSKQTDWATLIPSLDGWIAHRGQKKNRQYLSNFRIVSTIQLSLIDLSLSLCKPRVAYGL